ncbi:MAG TPA: hypothetical protein DEG44_05335 [Candidatus Kerfeldbacteria bacterium]|nr:hypothetical protein [Candidatus Kerfeldbacteria bacterium]
MILSLLLLAHVITATTGKIYPIADDQITTTTVTFKYQNIRAAKKFKFQLYDKRAGRTSWRKLDTFYKKRTSKTAKKFSMTLSNLKQDRDYRIRYKPIYVGGREGIWSDYRSWHTKDDALYIYLDTEDSLLTGDIPYVLIEDSGEFAMTLQDDGRWYYELDGITKDDIIQYRFSRNNLGPRSYELFDPDDVDKLHSVTISSVPQTKEHTTTDWRLLTPDIETGEVSTEDYPVVDRAQFIQGVELTRDYPEGFSSYTATTFTSIADYDLSYVAIPYATRVIIGGDPVETNQSVDGYPTETQLETMLTEATTAGLTPILVIDFPINQENEETILADMAGDHANSYFSTYLTRWREAMNDGMDFAIAHNIEIVVLDTDFYDYLDFQDNTQQAYFSYILENDILPTVASGYTGTLTTKELSMDADFTWYQADEIDWLGDTWYPTTSEDLATIYGPLNTQYGKPVFFTNLGVFSIDGASTIGETVSPTSSKLDPDLSNDTYTLDTQEQADVYEAVFRDIADTSYVIGTMAPDYSFFTQYDKLSNIRDKVAGLVWQRWAGLFNE